MTGCLGKHTNLQFIPNLFQDSFPAPFKPTSRRWSQDVLHLKRHPIRNSAWRRIMRWRRRKLQLQVSGTSGDQKIWLMCCVFWDYASESDRDYKDAYYRNQPVYWTAIEVLNLCWGGEGNLFFFGMRCSQASKQEPFGWARSRPRSKWMCVTYIPVLRRC